MRTLFLCILFLTIIFVAEVKGSGRGICYFKGEVTGPLKKYLHEGNLATLSDGPSVAGPAISFRIKVNSQPRGYCACNSTPSKGSLINSTIKTLAPPNCQKEGEKASRHEIQSCKKNKGQIQKLAIGDKYIFSANCSDGMGSMGCIGMCSSWKILN